MGADAGSGRGTIFVFEDSNWLRVREAELRRRDVRSWRRNM